MTTTMIPTPDIDVPDDLVKLARSQYPTEDAFTEVIARFGVESLIPMVLTAYFCESCSCRFMPDSDGGLWYRDRYTFVNGDGNSSCKDCPCHALPYQFAPLPGHCATCEASLYVDSDEVVRHCLLELDREHTPIHVVPVTERDMDDLRQGLLRIQSDLTERSE